MLQNEKLAATAVSIALSEVGIKEATGHNDGVFVRMLQRWLAKGYTWMDGQPWCATFATWCIYKAAKGLEITPVLPKDGSSSDLFKMGRSLGLMLASPIPNCIGLIKGNGGTPGKTHHHTFLVVSVDLVQGIVHGVDGNWGNAVSKTAHRIDECNFVAIA